MEDPLSAFGDFGDQYNGSSSEPPPPPYDSLVLTSEEPPQAHQASSSQASTSRAAPAVQKPDGPKDFEIFVTDPVKQGDGVGAYVSYKVWSKTRLPQYKNPEHEVIRRYKDFDWIFNRLQATNRGVIVPPLPEKNAVAKISATTDFIETRRRALQVFINKVAEHPVLKTSPTLQLFLEVWMAGRCLLSSSILSALRLCCAGPTASPPLPSPSPPSVSLPLSPCP